jgi:hypothetical protein
MKKAYTAAFKAQVVLEMLKETKTLSQLSSEYGVHVTVLRDWKAIALKGLPELCLRAPFRDSIHARGLLPHANSVGQDNSARHRRIAAAARRDGPGGHHGLRLE